MKFKNSILLIAVSLVLLISSTSCIILHPHGNSGNSGKRGWYKNSNNPHNPNTTNPGHSGKSKGRGHK
jgi:hypothetical protein